MQKRLLRQELQFQDTVYKIAAVKLSTAAAIMESQYEFEFYHFGTDIMKGDEIERSVLDNTEVKRQEKETQKEEENEDGKLYDRCVSCGSTGETFDCEWCQYYLWEKR